jgi:HPt (histidine-containing phosphotransfer) domain-containing protein
MEPTADAAAPIDAPPLVPVEAAIDLKHLARMTLGERSLEAEVLMLFDRQAAVLLDHMRQAAPQAIAAFAHTLKGSARGIGAWRVAAAAETVEIDAGHPDVADVAGAVARLAVAVDEARTVIAAWLEPHTCSG